MKGRFILLGVAGALLALAEPLAVLAQETSTDPFQATVRPLLQTYCFGCHGEVAPKGDLNLSAFRTTEDVRRTAERWQRIWKAVHTQEMPPEPPLPTSAERATLSRAIAEILTGGPEGPRTGQSVVRRLNQVEYNNSVLDLFRLPRPIGYYDPPKGMPESARVVLHQPTHRTVVPLPPDPVSEGFVNMGEALALPPYLMEKYLTAARQMVDSLAATERSREVRKENKVVPDQPEYTRAFVHRLVSSYGVNEDEGEHAARTFLATFGRRAFRRPLTKEELDRYCSLYQGAIARGDLFEDALKSPIGALFVSPHFLFRAESGIDGEDRNGLRPVSDYELATRLSYFLWSTAPDEELLQLAEQGRLRDPDALAGQARRMLRNRFSKEFSYQFCLQWLGIAGIRSAMPFPDLYPHYYKLNDPAESMQQEALLLFETILVEDRSVLDFIDPGFTWMNSSLNALYGIDAERNKVHSNKDFFLRYELTDKRRGGVVGMAGPMLATSHAERTSPVLRGKWVLERLLGAPPPPPPPNVNNVLDAPVAEDHLSFRERLQRHRADAACASCHRRMDPIGFGLENYDAIGAWRDADKGTPVDGAGEFLDGARFNGPAELKELLLTRYRDDFLRCLTEKMLTYALGRKLDYYDAPAVAEIVEDLRRDDYRFSTLVIGIVRSEPFRYMAASNADGEPSRPVGGP